MSETDSAFPWIMFFPTDHLADVGLRLSSLGARGLWADMLCIMYGGEPHGYLCRGGKPITVPLLARLVGATEEEVARYLGELRGHGVFSEDETGIYNRRMLRDDKKREQDRVNGLKGGNPQLLPRVKRGVNPRLNTKDKAQSPEARAQRSKAIDQKSENSSAVTVSVPVPVRSTVYELAKDILELVRADIPVAEANLIIVAEYTTRWLEFGWERTTILETIRSVLARPREGTKQFSLAYFEEVIRGTRSQIAHIRGRRS